MRARIFLGLIAWLITACEGERISSHDPYSFDVPTNFPGAVYSFENNALTGDGFELGRMLFYDPILSADSTIACVNCHQQSVAFSDPVHRFSKGVLDESGFRNAIAIQNLAFQEEFFWDGGVRHLDFVPINAITSSVEMAEELPNVLSKLGRSKFYPSRFKAAFNDENISSQNLLFALSQFMTMMISSNSRYDKYVRQEGEMLSKDELDGMNLFNASCARCHATDLFTDHSYRNNGLDMSFEKDEGRARVTEYEPDAGKFKVPSLRNAEITGPYMHDGRFSTLKQVLDHYAHGVQYSESLDPILIQEGSAGISLTDDDKNKIIAFIKTLTDRQFTSDKRFSNPFKSK